MNGVARPLPGTGVVVRDGDLFLVCAEGGDGVDELIAVVGEVARTGGDGANLVRRVAALLAADVQARFPACALTGPAADGRLAVLVYGDAVAEIATATGTVTLSGVDAITSVDQLVAGQVERVRLALPGAGEPDERSRLGAGIVPGAGLVFTTSSTVDSGWPVVPAPPVAFPGTWTRPTPPRGIASPVFNVPVIGPPPPSAPVSPSAPPPSASALPQRLAGAIGVPGPRSSADASPEAWPGGWPGADAPAGADAGASAPAPPAPGAGEWPVAGDTPAPVAVVGADEAGAALAAPDASSDAGVSQDEGLSSDAAASPGEAAPHSGAGPHSEAAPHDVAEHGADGRPAAEPLPSDPSATASPEAPEGTGHEPSHVIGVFCPKGHFIDPRNPYCPVCGISLAQQTVVAREGVRPALGSLLLDDGETVTLDADYLIGRDPKNDPDVQSGSARPLRIVDAEGVVSRRHARIALVGWDVQLIDLGSSNGTFIQPPGAAERQKLTAHVPAVIRPGTVITLGRRWLRFEPPRVT